MKAFGGTTRLWGGQLVPFDSEDLASVDDAGRSLWPIGYPEFARWIDAAYDLLGIEEAARDSDTLWRRATGLEKSGGHGLRAILNIWLRQPDFTVLFGEELERNPLITVVTDAEVTSLRFAAGGAVESLEIACPNGTAHVHRPERVVLANGTFEIARQLLRAQALEADCPFRDNRNVGRYYIDHLHGIAGEVVVHDRKAFSRMFDTIYAKGRKYSVKFCIDGTRPQRSANIAVSMNPRMTAGGILEEARGLMGRMFGGEMPVGKAIAQGYSLGRVLLPLAGRYLLRHRAAVLLNQGVRLGVEIEQLPVWDSYLFLDPAFPPERAPVGVNWQVDGREMQLVKPICEGLATLLGKTGIGILDLDPRILADDPAFLDGFHNSGHYMGGARMAEDALDGVVDRECRVFGSGNLYVAGAAVFPTGSFANSTLSAIALGLRLTGHLVETANSTDAGDGILPRLVFGCGRLTGGASRREALGQLRTVFDAGVRAVDVAPSYGIGTAETIVGEAVRRHPAGASIEIITKVGLPPPRWRWIKTALRAGKRALRAPRPRALADWTPVEPTMRFDEGDFRPESIERSVEISRRRLGRFDRLLLHACGPGELSPEVREALAALTWHHGAQPGYAIGSRHDPVFDQQYPSDYFAECAIDPSVLGGGKNSSARKDTLFHSVVPAANYLCRSNPAFAAALDRAAALLSDCDPATARIAAIYVLAASREPDARFVFASADSGRLSRLLAAFGQIDDQGLAVRIGAEFA